MDGAVSKFLEHIEVQLSPALCDDNRRNIATDITTDDDVAFLHTLGAHGDEELVSKKYKLYAAWLHGGDFVAHIPNTPSMIVTCDNVVNIAGVTKSGNLVVSSMSKNSILSAADGSVIAEFRKEGFDVTVDLEGRFWKWNLFVHTVYCFSEAGLLLHEIPVPFRPIRIAFLSDGGIVFFAETFEINGASYKLYFYSSDFEQIRSASVGHFVDDIQVCRATNEIYMLTGEHISIFSSEGEWLQDICHDKLLGSESIAVTNDKRVFVCEYDARSISVWSDNGTRVCQRVHFPYNAKPYNIALLPHGKLAVCFFCSVDKIEIRIFDLYLYTLADFIFY